MSATDLKLLKESYELGKTFIVNDVSMQYVRHRIHADVKIAKVTAVQRKFGSLLEQVYVIQRSLGVGVVCIPHDLYIEHSSEQETQNWKPLIADIAGLAIHQHPGVILDVDSAIGLVCTDVKQAVQAITVVCDNNKDHPVSQNVLGTSDRLKIPIFRERCIDYNNRELPVAVQQELTRQNALITLNYQAGYKISVLKNQVHARDGRLNSANVRPTEAGFYYSMAAVDNNCFTNTPR